MSDEEHIPRRDYIAMIMQQQGIQKNPRKYIVLRGWNTIVDHDVTYEVQPPPLPVLIAAGEQVHVMAKPDSPDLTRAKVIEDRGHEGLWVEPMDFDFSVQFLVPREDVRVFPIPLRPFAIPRSDLGKYIGDDAADQWHKQRKERRDRRQATAE